jgi:hypothetical protein
VTWMPDCRRQLVHIIVWMGRGKACRRCNAQDSLFPDRLRVCPTSPSACIRDCSCTALEWHAAAAARAAAAAATACCTAAGWVTHIPEEASHKPWLRPRLAGRHGGRAKGLW